MVREGLCEETDAGGMEPRKLCVALGEGQRSRPRLRSHTLGFFGEGKEAWCGWSAGSLGESGEKSRGSL